MKATAVSCANIAFIKYWGVRVPEWTLPFNGSLSMNLDSCTATTTVSFEESLAEDVVLLALHGGAPQLATGLPYARVVSHLNRLRALAGTEQRAHVRSANNFPADAGIASSAAGFAALTVAAAGALGLDLDERTCSILARRSGSGSACRSIPGGFVRWESGYEPGAEADLPAWDARSYAFSIAPADHWALADVVAVVDTGAKKIGSAENHRLALTSPYFGVRLDQVQARLDAATAAVLQRDLTQLGEIMEADCVSMHVVCMTSTPPSFYWNAGTMQVIHAVREWRAGGLECYYTIDAGPNVHVICAAADRPVVEARLRELPLVQFTISNSAGPGAHLTGA